MVSLKAAKISKEQSQQLTKSKQQLEGVIAKTESHSAKVVELRKKETQLRKKADSLKHGAAAFRLDDEIQLSAATTQIQRALSAIAEAEGQCHDDKAPLMSALDQAQDLVQQFSQPTYAELIETIGNALTPFFDSRANAEWVARETPAVRALTGGLLRHRTSSYDSIEVMHSEALDVLRKVNALLTGDVIWTYQGPNGEGEKS